MPITGSNALKSTGNFNIGVENSTWTFESIIGVIHRLLTADSNASNNLSSLENASAVQRMLKCSRERKGNKLYPH